ncbi:PHB depolymerase family esterase [Frankia sp. CiP1_Cm_nod1]|uniref:PHB depolymerase family esterase n=1 Tax=Frankia sp. CiP1_Cm_nod1 TaxID=2897160 RepID=UPI00202592AC
MSNPLKAGKQLWAKNRKRVLIIGAVLVVAWIYVSRSGSPDTERAKIPAGYASAERELAVHADADPGKPLPLVLVLHDNNSDAAAIEKITEASTLADRQHFAVVYPEAVDGEWRLDDPRGADVQYLRDVVRYVSEKRSKIDQSKIYIWGLGEGGRAALTIACGAPDNNLKFAAVAVVGPVGQVPNCPSGTHVQHVDGTWDKQVTRSLWDFSRKPKA